MVHRRCLTVISIAVVFLTNASASAAVGEPERASAAIQSFGTATHGDPLRYLILGDSTAVGIGATEGSGIAIETARHLSRSRGVEMKNLAVSGAQTNDVLVEQLLRIGGFVPDLVLLAFGANDVTHLTTAGSVENDLEKIIGYLLVYNCDVKIVVTGAPDMSTPPRIPWILRGIAGRRTSVLNRVFRRAVETHDLTFAPIAEKTGPLFRSDRSLFSPDEFHPNDRGYRTWVDVLVPALDQALASQPSHCQELSSRTE